MSGVATEPMIRKGAVWFRRENAKSRANEPDWCHMLLCVDARGRGTFVFFHESGKYRLERNGDCGWVAWECWERAPS